MRHIVDTGNTRKASEQDARQSNLSLTKKGRAAMESIETLLGERTEPKTPYVLRPHQPGDMGWVIHRHDGLYTGVRYLDALVCIQ